MKKPRICDGSHSGTSLSKHCPSWEMMINRLSIGRSRVKPMKTVGEDQAPVTGGCVGHPRCSSPCPSPFRGQRGPPDEQSPGSLVNPACLGGRGYMSERVRIRDGPG
jgi:hypothetical protein